MTLSSPSLVSKDSLQTLVNHFALVLLVLASGLQFILSRSEGIRTTDENGEADRRRLNSEVSLLIPAYAFLAVPVLIWIFSRSVKAIFCDRYMLPTALAWSILLAYVASRLVLQRVPTIWDRETKGHRLRTAVMISFLPLAALILLLLAQPVVWAREFRQGFSPGFFDNEPGYNDLPVVVQNSHIFLQYLHYSPARKRYFFILDRQAALNEASGLFGPQEFKNLEALARNYPDLHKQIVYGEDFLRTYDRFLVAGSLESNTRVCSCTIKGGVRTEWKDLSCPQWLRMRVLDNPRYKIQALGRTLLLVESR